MSSSDPSATRSEIQRIATHILARARKAADGEISLRIGLTGITTPAFGEHREVLRFAGPLLMREAPVGGNLRARVLPIRGSSLGQLAAFAGVDLDQELDFGGDAPAIGDRERLIDYDEAVAEELLRWYRIGATALDQIAGLASDPSVAQLWPEHFDVAVDAETGSGRVNLGASPADGASPANYMYVGPHTDARPGDAAFWNAPFGAILSSDAILAATDPVSAAVEFFTRGLQLLG